MKTTQLSTPVAVAQLRPQQPSRQSVWDRLTRYSAAIALLTTAILLPLQARIWNGPGGPPISVRLTRWLAPKLGGEVAASAMGQPPLTYFQVGHWFILVYISLLLTILFSRAIPHTRIRRGLLLTLTVGGVADAGVYWWGEYLTKAARESLFWTIEVPALMGSLGLVTVIAFQLRQSAGLSRIALALPFLVVPIALAVTMLFQYLPHGPMLSIALTLGFLVSRPTGESAPLTRQITIRSLLPIMLISGMLGLSTLVTYQPRRLAGPVIGRMNPIPYQTKTGVCLHMFNTGYNRMSRALVPGNPIWRPAPAFVIEHPTEGLIVFDGGLSSAVARRGEAALPFPMSVLFESRGEPTQTLVAQMLRVGLDPARVRTVILSHLHEDHLGDLNAFPNARIVLSAQADTSQLPRINQIVGRAQTAPSIPSSLGTLYDLLGDGTVQLLRGGGHSSEDLMAWVNLDGGPVLLAGDAVVHWDWLRSDDVERVTTDGPRAARVRNQLRALLTAQPQLVLFPGHDTSRIPGGRPDIILEHPQLFSPKAWASRLSLPM